MQHETQESPFDPETQKKFNSIVSYLLNVKGMSEGYAEAVGLELVNDTENTFNEVIIPSEQFSESDIFILRTIIDSDNQTLKVFEELMNFLIDIKLMTPDQAKSLAYDLMIDTESTINDVLIPGGEFTKFDIKNLESLLKTLSK